MKRLASLLCVCALAAPAAADAPRMPSQEKPHVLDGVGIVERPGAKLLTGLMFRDQDDKLVTLADYMDGTHPVLLVLAYYRCPKFCSIVLNGVLEGAKEVGLEV